MKIYKISKQQCVIGTTPKGRDKKAWVEVKEEMELNQLIKLGGYDGLGQMESLLNRVDTLERIITQIMLDKPELFKSYFEDIIRELNYNYEGIKYEIE